MKSKNIYMKYTYTLLIVLSLCCSGCNDFLNEAPDNRIEVNTLDKASELLVAAYPNVDYLFTDWFTEEAEYIETNNQTPLMTESFMWEELGSYDDTNSPSGYWYAAYKSIAQANSALEALENIEDEDDVYRNAIKGEAFLCRAYSHFMIATLFCNNYDSTTAIKDMGIPYVAESEKQLIKEYDRGTLANTYEKIEADLLAGLKLVSDDYYSGSKKYHFTKQAAYAFASRFYLYKKDYNKSIEYADKVFGGSAINKAYIKDLIAYSEQSGVTEKMQFYINNGDASNILIVEKLVSIGLRHNYGYRTAIKSWNALFEATIFSGNDFRYRYMSYYGDGSRNVIKAAKFDEEFYKESLTATTGYPFYVQAVFRGEDLLFNRIESYIQLGDLDKALNDLNEFSQYRYSTPVALTISDVQAYYTTVDEEGVTVVPSEKEALLQLCLSEKRKEYIHEGMRWFDIKRYNIEVTHITFDHKKLVLEKNDLRKVLQIPIDATEAGLTKNPR